jgi:hypothetical protein
MGAEDGQRLLVANQADTRSNVVKEQFSESVELLTVGLCM